MKLRAVPQANPQHRPLEQYASWCQARGRPLPAMFVRATEHIWVESETRLVLGVALFASPGYLMADFLATNPEAGLLERHRAVRLAMDIFVSSALTRALMPLAHPRTRGVAKVLERKGFTVEPVLTMVREVTLQVSYREKAPKPVKKKRRTGPRRRKKVAGG